MRLGWGTVRFKTVGGVPMAEITTSVQELTADEREQRLNQCIEALKFAHDNLHKAVAHEDEEHYQASLMNLIEELGIERMALDAERGQIAHG